MGKLIFEAARCLIVMSLLGVSLITIVIFMPFNTTHSMSPRLTQLQSFIGASRGEEKVITMPAIRAAKTNFGEDVFLSVVILTYNSATLVNRTLSTLLQSPGGSHVGASLIPPWRWEVLLVDNGCLPSTWEVYAHHRRYHTTTKDGHDFPSSLRYIPLCNNTRYSVANNLAVSEYTARSAQWLLFLNDDVVPQQRGRPGSGGSFLWNFHSLLAAHTSSHPSATRRGQQQKRYDIGAVGCKLLFGHHKIVEAGSVILSSGKTDNYLRCVQNDSCVSQFSIAVLY